MPVLITCGTWTWPADVVVPNGAGPSTGRMLVGDKMNMIFVAKVSWLIILDLFLIIVRNSLAPGGCGSNFQSVVFKFILHIDILSTSHKPACKSMPQDCIKDNSTFIQVMAWCHHSTSHYLHKCWSRCKYTDGHVQSFRIYTFGSDDNVF